MVFGHKGRRDAPRAQSVDLGVWNTVLSVTISPSRA
jgi:hypothetical protein